MHFTSSSLPERYTVRPVFSPGNPAPDLRVCVPGSKSLTNRALLLAALADGNRETTLDGILLSDDSRHFISCLRDLGFKVYLEEALHRIRITGCGGSLPRGHGNLYVGSAGTAARFLTALLGLAPGLWHLDASEQMRKRPMQPLLTALESFGCRVSFEGEAGHFPFTLSSNGPAAAEVTVNIDDSSQFLSALMMASVLARREFTIRITGSHGFSYVEMTAEMMHRFGAPKIVWDNKTVRIPAFTSYRSGRYSIEPDVSAACYFYALAAVSGGRTLVQGVHPDSLQGDVAFLDLLQTMGCRQENTPDGILLTGPAGGRLRGIDADMHAFSDQALTLAAIAPFADSPVTIRGISHIRLQECDRIRAILTNLTRMGIDAKCSEEDVLTIFPGAPGPAEIETFDDHRVAMAFAVTGLRTPGITILNPACCRKTFENYFDVLDSLCGSPGPAPGGASRN